MLCGRKAQNLWRFLLNIYIFFYERFFFVFYFTFFFYKYNTRTCRSARVNITKFTTITLITITKKNYTTSHYKDYITYSTKIGWTVIRGILKKRGLDNSYCCIDGSKGFHFLSWIWIVLLFFAIKRSVWNVFLNLSTKSLMHNEPLFNLQR